MICILGSLEFRRQSRVWGLGLGASKDRLRVWDVGFRVSAEVKA